MFKRLEVHEGDSGVHFCYGTVGEHQGSWMLLNPIELQCGIVLHEVYEAHYLVEAFELNDNDERYLFYNCPVHGGEPIGIDHFELCCKYNATEESLIPLVKLVMVQLGYGLLESKLVAEELKANGCATARAHYLKAKTR